VVLALSEGHQATAVAPRGLSGNGSGPVDMSSTSMVSFDAETFNKLKDACTLLGSVFSNGTEEQERTQIPEKIKIK
jgi:hypothetical protein